MKRSRPLSRVPKQQALFEGTAKREGLSYSKSSGIFITIEGPNGVGKTALVKAVTRRLNKIGITARMSKEPTRSELGDLVRRAEDEYPALTLACLAAADRYSHIESSILPALKKDKVVVLDRYVESSLVLQRLDGLLPDFVWGMNSSVLVPDVSVILTCAPQIMDRRVSQRQRRSRFETTHSRKEEMSYYLDAGKFLSRRGFNVIFLENSSVSLSENVDAVVDLVLGLRRKRPLRAGIERRIARIERLS